MSEWMLCLALALFRYVADRLLTKEMSISDENNSSKSDILLLYGNFCPYRRLKGMTDLQR